MISETISDLRDSIDELEGRIQFMNEELEAKKKRLEIWKRRLAALYIQDNLAERRRRPKGENLRAVIATLQNTIAGLAASEIQRKTGLPWSSIQATLKRHPDLFVEVDGLWRRTNVPVRPKTEPQNNAEDDHALIDELLGSEKDESGEATEE